MSLGQNALLTSLITLRGWRGLGGQVAWILEIQEEALLEDLHMLTSVRTNQNGKRTHTHTCSFKPSS